MRSGPVDGSLCRPADRRARHRARTRVRQVPLWPRGGCHPGWRCNPATMGQEARRRAGASAGCELAGPGLRYESGCGHRPLQVPAVGSVGRRRGRSRGGVDGGISMRSASRATTETARQRPCLLPPHLLERIARNGSAEQRARALATLATDDALRSARLSRQAIRASQDRVHASAPSGPHRTICDAGSQERLPGRVRRNEGAPATGDAAVDEA